ncbi:MAG: hypothetical protein MJY71_08220 [Bacteroidaceae bacterium]|nr:hypothetical protein [Bacteroidaceae bacterium]
MASKKGKFSKKGNLVGFYGTPDLLKKIEKANGNVKKAVETAVLKSIEPATQDMKEFIRTHRETGVTEDAFDDGQVKWNGDSVNIKSGFDIEKGGLPALFLDIGTPSHSGRNGTGMITGITPTFFVYYAVENNMDKIMKIQQQTLEDILKGLI